MFSDCSNLKSIDVSHFNTSKCSDFYAMFAYCKMTTLNISNFDTSYARSRGSSSCDAMFDESAIKTVYVQKGWYPSPGRGGGGTMKGCKAVWKWKE